MSHDERNAAQRKSRKDRKASLSQQDKATSSSKTQSTAEAIATNIDLAKLREAVDRWAKQGEVRIDSMGSRMEIERATPSEYWIVTFCRSWEYPSYDREIEVVVPLSAPIGRWHTASDSNRFGIRKRLRRRINVDHGEENCSSCNGRGFTTTTHTDHHSKTETYTVKVPFGDHGGTREETHTREVSAGTTSRNEKTSCSKCHGSGRMHCYEVTERVSFYVRKMQLCGETGLPLEIAENAFGVQHWEEGDSSGIPERALAIGQTLKAANANLGNLRMCWSSQAAENQVSYHRVKEVKIRYGIGLWPKNSLIVYGEDQQVYAKRYPISLARGAMHALMYAFLLVCLLFIVFTSIGEWQSQQAKEQERIRLEKLPTLAEVERQSQDAPQNLRHGATASAIDSEQEARNARLRHIGETLLNYDSYHYWQEDSPSPVLRLDESISGWREELATTEGTDTLIALAGKEDVIRLHNCAVCLGRNGLESKYISNFLLYCLRFQPPGINFNENANRRAVLIRVACYVIAKSRVGTPEIVSELVKTGNPLGTEMTTMRALLELHYAGYPISPEAINELAAYEARLASSLDDSIIEPKIAGRTLASHAVVAYTLAEIRNNSRKDLSTTNYQHAHFAQLIQEWKANSQNWSLSGSRARMYSAAAGDLQEQERSWKQAMTRSPF